MKHPWRRRISEEFGSPTVEVIRSFAESGYSKRLTAGALGISRPTLIRFASRHDITFPDRSGMIDVCNPGRKTGPRCGRQRVHSDEFILDCVRQARTSRQLRGVAIRTVLLRFGSWSEAKRLARRAA